MTIALACGAALIVPGCGGDDEKSSETETPRLTVPSDDTTAPTTTETTPPQTQTTPPPQTAPGDSGGSTAPTTPDSPQNDTKPKPDTPEGRFEEFCDKNPGACG
jgi:hypothetical protein